MGFNLMYLFETVVDSMVGADLSGASVVQKSDLALTRVQAEFRKKS